MIVVMVTMTMTMALMVKGRDKRVVGAEIKASGCGGWQVKGLGQLAGCKRRVAGSWALVVLGQSFFAAANFCAVLRRRWCYTRQLGT